jgi:ribokinase
VIRPDDEHVIAAARVVVCQLEIPMATVVQAAQLTTGMFILNAAPAAALPRELRDKVDVLIVNEVECATIFGSVETSDIRAGGIPTVVTTLGSRGAVLTTQSRVDSIPAPIVDVLDTTGAGDTFCGAFAQAIDAGMDAAIAARRAVVAASIATTKVGARSAMPDTNELERKLIEMTGRTT